jgi:hypothetical protein
MCRFVVHTKPCVFRYIALELFKFKSSIYFLSSFSRRMLMENPANVLPFEGVDPDLIMKELLNLKNTPNRPTKNDKEFWSSYITTKWAKFEVNQKARVVVFWEENITKAAREYILEEVRKLIGKEINVEKERCYYTKHDFARIIHLRVDPAAAADWTAALREKSRLELDARHDADADPWNRLVEKFNNYEQYNYANNSILGNQISASGLPAVVPQMEALAKICYDINPTYPNRPLRDGHWLRDSYRKLKNRITPCFNNYTKSGNQAAENEYDEWVNFAERDTVVAYSRAVLTLDNMDRLGRLLPEVVQRDTGILPTDEEQEKKRKMAAETRKKQRLDRKSREQSSTPSPPQVSNVSSAIIEAGMAEANFIHSLNIMLQFGNEHQKIDALKQIEEITTRKRKRILNEDSNEK